MSKPVFVTRKPRGLRQLLDVWTADYVSSKSTAINARRSHKMAIFANDLIGIYINQFGTYEKEELDILFEFLAPLRAAFKQGICLDVGANIGNHSLYFAPHFARVECFEPNPATFHLLAFNCSSPRPSVS